MLDFDVKNLLACLSKTSRQNLKRTIVDVQDLQQRTVVEGIRNNRRCGCVVGYKTSKIGKIFEQISWDIVED